jgi:hypothetical protein
MARFDLGGQRAPWPLWACAYYSQILCYDHQKSALVINNRYTEDKGDALACQGPARHQGQTTWVACISLAVYIIL